MNSARKTGPRSTDERSSGKSGKSGKSDRSPKPGDAVRVEAEPRRESAFGLESLPDAAEPSTSEFVYRQILDAVLSQRLRRGARLTELALAEIFSIGRSTVRDVLQRLALEGVVDMRVNRGAVVSEPQPDEVRSLFEARRAMRSHLDAPERSLDLDSSGLGGDLGAAFRHLTLR